MRELISIPIRASYTVTDGIAHLEKAEYVQVSADAVAEYLIAHAGPSLTKALEGQKTDG